MLDRYVKKQVLRGKCHTPEAHVRIVHIGSEDGTEKEYISCETCAMAAEDEFIVVAADKEDDMDGKSLVRKEISQ